MKTIKVPRVWIFFVVTIFARVLLARELPDPPHQFPNIIGLDGFTTTVMAHYHSVDSEKFKNSEKIFTLPNGTQLKGALFLADKEKRPLIIANFGVLSDRWSRSAAWLIRDIAKKHKLKVHLLVIDSMSSYSFYSLNKTLSLGGYDEGRVFVELASILDPNEIPYSSIHLFGVSLGGTGVLHALLEDARLGTHYFRSAITFSAVVDQFSITECMLNSFGYQLSENIECKLQFFSKLLIRFGVKRVKSDFGIKFSADNISTIGQFYKESFERHLRTGFVPDWNVEISRDSVSGYLRTSSNLLKNLSSIQVPVIMIHAKNDPIVSYKQFLNFAEEEKNNENVYTHLTHFGGHWGFHITYGSDWINALIERMLEYGAGSPVRQNTPAAKFIE